VLCRGDKGQPTPPVEDLAAVRRAEMAESVALLGAELLTGEFPDGLLFDGPAERHAVTELLRRFAPTLVLAHFAGDYHADHRAASALAEAATWACASSGFVTVSPPLPAPPALWWMDAVNLAGFLPEFFIDVSAFVELKRRMLACHRTQLRRGGDTAFAPLDELMLRQCQTRGDQAGVVAAEAFRAHQAWKRARAW
jgi:LmbE family N-acetylglucosaminyl deacetylase